jgi:hypothetical protein
MDVVLLTLTVLSLAAAAGFGALSWRVGREERERSQARMASLSAAMDPVSEGERVAVGSVFERGADHLRGRPMIKVAVGGVMALALVVGAIIGVQTGNAPSAARIVTGSLPLELVSMRHQREGTTLRITGLVRNPSAGAPANGVSAVVVGFDRTGGVVATGRAPLDFAPLAPGDESPFIVAIPNAPDVARYRVSFRTSQGVVRHIDRRGQAELLQAGR